MYAPIPWYYHLMPYCVAERLIRDRLGASAYLKWIGDDRIKRTFRYWLPYCMMARHAAASEERKRGKARRAVVTEPSVPVSGFRHGDPQTECRGDFARDDAKACPRKVRILVCLHLYYPDMWPVVRRYLDHLTPYRVRTIVTYPEGLIPQETLRDVLAYREGTLLKPCRNAGFDIGPFVESLAGVDLDEYDLVFKLQTKGSHRDSIAIYDQVFKHEDWFFNLYDGILGGSVVHRVVDGLSSGRASLAAAANLIVRDPAHKRAFVERACRERGLPYDADYRFVAGTCFAVRAEVLKPLQALGLRLADFEATARGTFSLAHFLERWMCFAAGDRLMGVPTDHARYPEEAEAFFAGSAYPLLEDGRFEVDPDFFYRSFEFVRIGGYEVVEVRLRDIRRVWFDRRAYRLEECSAYRYLEGDAGRYREYCHQNAERSGFDMTSTRFEALRSSMEEYDGRHLPIVFGEENVILDGQHRCCILLRKFGPDFRLKVVRILPPGEVR